MPEQADPEFVKILFRYYSDVLETETVETMWAKIVDRDAGWYKLDSIPFYGPSVASDDIILATYNDDEQMLTFREVVKQSGNSIVQVVLMSDNFDKETLRKEFADLGCISEGVNNKYFVMEIPATVDYAPIKKILLQLEERDLIAHAEPMLSNLHHY